ncbi:MAG: hypothetical protein E7497_01355 [Ruminococcus sp.]|nr:hypothetical protein [Ruminococcus sp.]
MTDKKFSPDDEKASEIADLIDRLMTGGSRHVNISANDIDGSVSVETVKSTDCAGTKGACCQPTEGDDDDYDDEF